MKVVDKYSAQLGLVQSETVLGIEDDHSQMVKFPSIDSPKYRIVWENIKYMAESIYSSRPLDQGAVSVSIQWLSEASSIRAGIATN